MSSRPRPQFSLGLVLAAWTVPALLSTLETVMFAQANNRPIDMWRAFASEAPGWYVWALFTPALALLADRFPLSRPLRARAIFAHVCGWLVVAASAAAVWAAAGMMLRASRVSYLASVRNWFLSGLPFTVLGYAAVVGICYMIANRNLAHEREQQAAVLARQLSEAQLATLRAQLQPHFLFNSLNAIMALVRDADSAHAIAALTTLSAILRASLQLGANAEIALTREVAFTRDYLDLERLRFPNRLRVTFDIPPALLDVAVPTFVLQPFVENAIKHGLMDSRNGIEISISARANGDSLELTITDDGVGFATENGATVDGLGIANARSRLNGMYGTRASLTTGRRQSEKGALVQLQLPLKRTLMV
ncbi:MAG: histidine kinase [Gemmatimonadaceae bacterium]